MTPCRAWRWHPRALRRPGRGLMDAVRTRLLHNVAANAAAWSDWASSPRPESTPDATAAVSETRHREQLHRIACLIELGEYDAALAETTCDPTY